EALRSLGADWILDGASAATRPVEPATLSLVDRFDTVLDAGRRIASALSRDAIFAAVREGAVRLLRGDRCTVLKIESSTEGQDVTAASGELNAGHSKAMIEQALTAGRAIAFIEGA